MQLVKEIVDNERLRDRADRLQNSTLQVIGIAVEKMEQRHNKGNNWKKLCWVRRPVLKLSVLIKSLMQWKNTDLHTDTSWWSFGVLRITENPKSFKRWEKERKKRKEITYRGSRIKLTANLSPGTINAISQWYSIIKILQEDFQDFQLRIFFLAKFEFDLKGKTKVIFDIEEFKNFMSDASILKELLCNVL